MFLRTAQRYLVAVLVIACCCGIPVFSESLTSKASGGVLELSVRNFTSSSSLKGEWSFVSEEISGPRYLKVPGTWENAVGTAYSSGEYQLLIKLPEEVAGADGFGGLLFPELSQAMEIRANGKLLAASGDMETGETGYTRFLLPVPLEREILLSVKLKNSVFRDGGLVYVPRFGDFDRMQRHRETKIWFESAILGLFLLIAIYHLFLFARGYRNGSALYLGIAAIMMMIRGITTGENIIYILLPNFSWAADYRIEYISAYLSAAAILRFFHTLFPHRHRAVRTSINIMTWILGTLCLMTAVVPISYLSKTIYVLVGTIFASFIIGIAILINALRERTPASGLFFWGGMVSISLFTVDSLMYIRGPANMLDLAQIGMMLFVLVQALVLSRIYGDAFLRAEELSRSLEEEVAERTADLKRTNLSLQKEIVQRKKIQERLTVLSTTDPLTGASNRHKMNAFLEQNHKVFQRYGSGYGVIMFDVDHFKRVNDEYGHEAGDEVLKEMVAATNRVIRSCDVLARWGGEEFLILMPTLDLQGTACAAERIRSALENTDFQEAGNVTASFGVSVPEKEETLEMLLARVDKNLYKAKQEGRNLVISR